MRGRITRLISLTTAVLTTSVLSVAAQTPAPPDRQRPATASDTLKLTGCLKMEKDVPGLKPSVAERAGVTEDYILTDAKLAKDSPVSGIGVGPMYEIEGIGEDRLRDHLNQHIEIEGRIGQAGGDGDAPDFNATSIRMIAATCPVK